MATQLGTVLVFKPETTRAQAEAAMKPLVDSGLLENYSLNEKSEPAPYRLNQFDPEMGGPVWYCP